MFLINKKLVKRVLRYVFFVAVICRVLISIYIGYQYVWFSSESVSSKGGTFVEGIFSKTSFLPYLGDDYQSNFYQGLLFNNCIQNPGGAVSTGDLCRIWTEDKQHFVIALNKGFIRSDGTPVSIDDLFFTFNDIIRNNKRNIDGLNIYKDLIIVQGSDNKLNITFPTPSKDNSFFFTNYILPQHILKDYDLENYKKTFGFSPVYTNCANVVSDSADPYSLIFNLADCTNSNLNFYQIKNTITFDEFKSAVQNGKDTMIDAYVGNETLNGYIPQKLTTNKMITVFFNTNAQQLPVRVRRVLGGLIKHNFYTTGYENFMQKNTDGLFDVFQSTGNNVQDLINRDYSAGSITKEDLIDINVQVLPKGITINKEDQKLAYFVDSGSSFPIKITFTTAYDRISMEYKGNAVPISYTAKTKTAEYTITTSSKTFGSGLNKYLIYGYVKKQRKLAATLDVYNMISEESGEIAGDTGASSKIKLSVIYYDSPLYNFVVERMKNIFKQFNIQDNFVFEKMTTPEELQGRLFAGDYDILVSVVDMGQAKDFTRLFGTDKSELNPSQYQNQKLVSLLQDYVYGQNKKALVEINGMYSKDMPFVILGKVFTKLNMKPTIAEKLLSGTTITNMNESNRRNLIYEKLQLVSNIHIDGKRVRSASNFNKFLKESLDRNNH